MRASVDSVPQITRSYPPAAIAAASRLGHGRGGLQNPEPESGGVAASQWPMANTRQRHLERVCRALAGGRFCSAIPAPAGPGVAPGAAELRAHSGGALQAVGVDARTGALALSYRVVWFKRDLRLHDHAALVHAARQGPVLCLYIVEPELWAQPDAALQHFEFVRESLAELQQSLQALGGDLQVHTGSAVQVLAALHQQAPFAELVSHMETGNAFTYTRDLAVAAWCRSQGLGPAVWFDSSERARQAVGPEGQIIGRSSVLRDLLCRRY